MVMFEIILFSLVVLSAAIIAVCRWVVPSLGTRDPEPIYLDYARSLFPVLLLVFLLRGFIAEPFRIPSGSMLPTLEVGDFILVNKYRYGLRLPILHNKIFEVSDPQRGDIMVFRVPKDNKTNYIKRVVGVPGDVIQYRNKRLFVNGELIGMKEDGVYSPLPKYAGAVEVLDRFSQTLPREDAEKAEEFSILINNKRRAGNHKPWVVPSGHYFMMGDNRDGSEDSRTWSFVPDKNIVGKAFFIWMHYNNRPGGGFKFSRLGTNI